MESLKHYKESNGYKIGDKVFVLDYYDIKETYIEDIFDDYYSDNDNFICKWVKTNRGYDHLEDVYKEERFAINRIQSKKDAYDRYVTRGY